MNNISRAKSDKIFHFFVMSLMILLAVIILYPLWFVLIASVSSPDAVLNGEVWIFPDIIDFSGYKKIFADKQIWVGYRNTILYTFFGTLLNIVLTIPAGYALSRKELPFKKGFMWFFIITMFFGGGLIPYYVLIDKLGLIDNPLVLIIPQGLSVWNMFMVKAYYESNIPGELIEAAEIDGAGHFRSFWSIILPISKPIVAVMVLFYAVGRWNSYFDAMLFIHSENLYPLQIILRNILIVNDNSSGGITGEDIYERLKLANQIKYGIIIVSSLPIILIYPFIQKHFEEGFLVGSFK
ncbi:carbohydrate ABC transporter permease [Haploplasma axanthum]|uniref:Inner membrane ABC transporter permease protein ycjP n=1 Tax=Haploplasma axanthum TaxID=29552 RepID=A0A449BG68_HAPAX|nr:carbohydrate ABC transporter permease [Haploplasma axanthum]VEU81290.1 Inner membrane ABC transporter permease protein ycjP [Haploplasma axanthum]